MGNNKSKYSLSYVSESKPEMMSNGYTPGTFGEVYTPGEYISKYQQQLDDTLGQIQNWSYDPMKDASYQALAKVYNQRGNIAAKNSLADAAALNGGYGSSFAVSAAQQARNQYNQELASLVPDLERNAYGRLTDLYSTLRSADDSDYGKFRDTEGDRWQQYLHRYDQFRDTESDRWNQYLQNYNEYRDLVGDWEWAKGFNTDLYQYKQAQKGKSGGGSGGGGGYSGSGYSGGGSTGNDNNRRKIYGNTPTGGTPNQGVNKPSSNYGYQSTPGGISSAANWINDAADKLKKYK